MKRKIDIVALIILIISAINLGLMGIFDVNIISWIFGGQIVVAIRIIYVIVAIAGLWCINLIVVRGGIGTVAHGRTRSIVREE